MDHLQMAWKECEEPVQAHRQEGVPPIKDAGRPRLSKISKGAFVQGRRLPVTKKDFERICELYAEGAFMSQCGLLASHGKEVGGLGHEGKQRTTR